MKNKFTGYLPTDTEIAHIAVKFNFQDKIELRYGINNAYLGDEDQGQMGALNVLMAMGLFSVNGGCSLEPFYEVTSPVFDRIVIHLDPDYYAGEQFVIEVERRSEEDVYIQSARLNGAPLERPWFHHHELARGGKLELGLGPEPNVEWGSRIEDAPPSMSHRR